MLIIHNGFYIRNAFEQFFRLWEIIVVPSLHFFLSFSFSRLFAFKELPPPPPKKPEDKTTLPKRINKTYLTIFFMPLNFRYGNFSGKQMLSVNSRVWFFSENIISPASANNFFSVVFVNVDGLLQVYRCPFCIPKSISKTYLNLQPSVFTSLMPDAIQAYVPRPNFFGCYY